MNIRTVFAAGLTLAAASAFAGVFDNALLKGRTDKDGFYRANEPITFTLRVEGVTNALPPGAYFITWERTGDDAQKQSGKVALPLKEPLVIKTALAKPGFVRVEARVVDQAGKRVRRPQNGKTMEVFFDGGAGVEPEKLQALPEPADFDAFWAKHKAALAAVPIRAERKEVPSRDKNVRVYAVSVACAGPRPVTGYLTIPVQATAEHPIAAQVVFHGYSGNSIQRSPEGGPHNLINFDINAHGYELGHEDAYYKEFYKSIQSHKQSYAFDPEQNKDPEQAYFCGMTYRVMRALQYVESLPEWNKKDLTAVGGSQGGLQTVWAAGLDPRVSCARPSIPWCCDLGGITMGRLVGGWRIEWVPALAYYDPVNIGKRISKTCDFEITRAGLGDYVCPPSGVAVLFNNVPAAGKKIVWVQGSEHGYVPPAPNQAFTIVK